MSFSDLLIQFSMLVGFAALVAAIINILKTAGLVQDGQAQTYSAILNLVGISVLLYLRVFQPQVDIPNVDAQIGKIADVLLVVFGYVLQLGGAQFTHNLLSSANIPIVGKSFSK